MRHPQLLIFGLATALAVLATVQPAGAGRVSDVRNTRHNLSSSGPGTVKATTETQVCVFCHTPHAAETVPKSPLWNRKLSTAGTYVPYTSSSIEASASEMALAPGGTSKLCLSCHDGTMALGTLNVLNGQANPTIPLGGTAGGKMPPGSGTNTGFTRNLGVNLTNDHPISFTYDSTLASADGELRTPDGTTVGTRSAGIKPRLPLEAGQVQCSTCHDPHLRETDAGKGPLKFLRLNRFQEAQPTGGAFSETYDIICLACHDKAGQAWALSAHANSAVATQVYSGTTTTAPLREFPAGLPVWKAACLACHDTHTVEGARRLLREGTDSTGVPKTGGGSAIEETCYQCHSSQAQSLLTNVATVPNIKDDFALARRMPITDADQQGTGEAHDIGTGPGTQRGKDFVESPAQLGKGTPANRHVECTDCHNPHRVTRNRLFNADATTPDAGGTHNHVAGHTNIASGVLRGTTGVEITTWAGVSFTSLPTAFALKRGDGGAGASTATGSAWVTREYQVCLKCHSNYAYNTPPSLGDSGGGTPSLTNGMTRMTNQGMEFQAPAGHRGESITTTDSGAYNGAITASRDFQTNNHRSWHPVIGDTGRSLAARGITDTSPWLAPWTNEVGTQTMYCSDCHGSDTAAGTVVPGSGKPWGPHGSSRDFILKGTWSDNSGTPDASTAICLKCHDSAVYASTSTSGARRTGFWNPAGSDVAGGNGRGNLHTYHAVKISGGVRCTWCHVAVPHGWKNRSLLVNLNDVGPEAGLAPGTQVRNGTTAAYYRAPYYLRAVLKIRTFGTPGSWLASNCGSSGAPGNGQSGRDWMRDGSENCANAP